MKIGQDWSHLKMKIKQKKTLYFVSVSCLVSDAREVAPLSNCDSSLIEQSSRSAKLLQRVKYDVLAAQRQKTRYRLQM